MDNAPVRTPHSVKAKGQTVFFADWDHPRVGIQPLPELIHRFGEENNWSRLISPGDVCIDVGAHCGDTSIVMALYAFDEEAKKPSTVIAVEPNRDVYPVLKHNAALNTKWADIRLSSKAITAHDNEIVILLDHGNDNVNGGIISDTYSDGFKQNLNKMARVRTEVQGITLESLCKELLSPYEMERLSFVKTDCEGYDKEIIRSSKDFIKSKKLTLFVEWFDLFTNGEDYDDFLVALDELGYVALNPNTLKRQDLSAKEHDLVLVHPFHPLALA